MSIGDLERYAAWYHTPRGAWIGETEFALMMQLVQPATGSSLLDVGSGTGYFSRKFAQRGLRVTGVDPDESATRYAAGLDGNVSYIDGSVALLPFGEAAFDYCAAVTSLCFVNDVHGALAEMWRVSRHGIVLGLLNRHSLLYRHKHDHGGYRSARWDSWSEVKKCLPVLKPHPSAVHYGTAIYFASGGRCARVIERFIPRTLLWGGFLAVYLERP